MFYNKIIVNNFMKKDDSIDVDKISKVYNILRLLLGINHVFIFNIKLVYKLAACLFTILYISGAIYIFGTVFRPDNTFFDYLLILQSIQFCSVIFVSIIFWKRMRNFYVILEKIDNEMSGKPTDSVRSIAVIVSMIIIAILSLISMISVNLVELSMCEWLIIVETHYYSHLLCLVGARLELLNSFVESLWSDKTDLGNEIVKSDLNKRNYKQLNLSSLMDIYTMITQAHERMIEAVTWPFLIMLVTAFLFILMGSYRFAASIVIADEYQGSMMSYMLVTTNILGNQVLTLIVPCVCADHNRALVYKYRQLLAKALQAGQLDKVDRNALRSILALTETENLSFTLLRMIDVSISLPFYFIGLLATYLIIMLQFKKIDPLK